MQFSIATGSVGKDWENREVVEGLYEALKVLEDKRKRRGIRYPLAVARVMLVVAKLCGQDELRGMADWVKWRAALFKEVLAYRQPHTPHHTTFSRILNEAVDLSALESVVNGSVARQQTSSGGHRAIDGKTLRGTLNNQGQQGQHLLAVYDSSLGTVQAEVAVDHTQNEISAAPALLASLDWEGKVVTGDAMFAQHALSAQIINAGGAYVWVIKDNQPNLRSAIERLFAPERCLKAHSPLHTDFQTATRLDKAHGRLEKRTLTSSGLLNLFVEWEGLAQVFKIERQVTHLKTAKITHQIDYGITSLSPLQAPPERLLALVRAHWQIENALHYPRDVSFHEDACRVRAPRVQHALAILNNLALAFTRFAHFESIPAARRFFDAHVPLVLDWLT